jgi:hypothetical protein
MLLYSNHRQILDFFWISKKTGLILLALGLGIAKIILKNSMSRIHALRQLFSGRVRLGFTEIFFTEFSHVGYQKIRLFA